MKMITETATSVANRAAILSAMIAEHAVSKGRRRAGTCRPAAEVAF